MDLENILNNEIEFKDNFKHIPYKSKIARAYEELLDTNPKDIIAW